jgi:hypothetical protein
MQSEVLFHEEIEENKQKLAACFMHIFDFPLDSEGRNFQCIQCGGRVSAEYKEAYDQGFKDGRAMEKILQDVELELNKRNEQKERLK